MKEKIMHQMPIEVRATEVQSITAIRQQMTLHNPEDFVDVLVTHEQIPDLIKALQAQLPKAERKAAAAPAATLFESHFWNLWPASKRKVDKQGCIKFWNFHNLDNQAEAIAAAVARASIDPDWTKENGAFIPMPKTWLNQRRWEAPAEEGRAPGSGLGRIL